MNHRCRHDGEMAKSFATWAVDASESRKTQVTFPRNAFGMVHILPSPARIDADKMSLIRADR